MTFGPPRFFTEKAPTGMVHALWCPPDGPGMDPPEMPDMSACGFDVTEEWEPDDSEWPTCKTCLRSLRAVYAEPVKKQDVP